MPPVSPLAQEKPDDFFNGEFVGLSRYVCRILRGTDGVTDVVQEAFLRFYAMERSVEPGAERALLFRLARNLAIDGLRERKKAYQLSGELVEIPVTVTPEDLLLRKERARLLHGALATLGERDQELLALRQAGISYLEIASILNLNPNSVGQLLARALRRFRQAYADMGKTENESSRSAQRR
jgi:RNA polymerase sigma factor (sigma-70 family)